MIVKCLLCAYCDVKGWNRHLEKVKFQWNAIEIV